MSHWISLVWEYLTAPGQWSVPADLWTGASIPALVFQHLVYTALALGLAGVFALPLGLLVGHFGRGSTVVVGVVNVLRSIPTLGVLLLALLLDGAGYAPPVLALALLAAAPLLAGAYAGVAQVDPQVVDAAYAVGMPRSAVLLRVQLPLALPLVLGGLRSAALNVVATATIAAYAGLGGLGVILIQGIQMGRYDQALAGALLVTVLTLALDAVLFAATEAARSRIRR